MPTIFDGYTEHTDGETGHIVAYTPSHVYGYKTLGLMRKILSEQRRRSSGEIVRWANAPVPFVIPEIGFPTEAPPGTREKVMVMTARAGRREPIFHPFDCVKDGDMKALLYYLLGEVGKPVEIDEDE